MRRSRFICLVSIILFGTAPLAAQDTSPEDEIIVIGQSEAEAVRDLAENITRKSRIDKPISRFQSPVCVKVNGMPMDMAAMVEERIRQNVERVGAKVGKPDCAINALVAFVNDAPDLLTRLRAEEPWLFNDMLEHEFALLADEKDGVRAWHTQMLRDKDGREIPIQKIKLPRYGRDVFMRNLRSYDSSRRLIPISMELTGAVVLFDLARIESKTFRQLADYATLRILALSGSENVSAESQSIPSITTLFDDPGSTPSALSTFDEAYLTALYGAPYYAMSGSLQNATLRRYRSAKGQDLDR